MNNVFFPARQLTVVAALSLHWSVPTCFVNEHRSSANQPATCPFPIGLFFWKLPPPACPGTTCILYVFYKKSSVKPSESCFEAVSSACIRKGIQKAPLFLASKIGFGDVLWFGRCGNVAWSKDHRDRDQIACHGPTPFGLKNCSCFF